MAVTSAKLPGTIATDSANGGTIDWTNPSNAGGDDGVFATTALLDPDINSYYIKCTNYGFTTGDIPSGSTINNVNVYIKGKEGAANQDMFDLEVKLVVGGTVSGNSKHSASEWTITNTERSYIYTKTDWGVGSLVDTDVRASNFGIVFSVKTTQSIRTATFSLDYIKVVIDYTVSSQTKNVTVTESGSSSRSVTTNKKPNALGTESASSARSVTANKKPNATGTESGISARSVTTNKKPNAAGAASGSASKVSSIAKSVAGAESASSARAVTTNKKPNAVGGESGVGARSVTTNKKPNAVGVEAGVSTRSVTTNKKPDASGLARTSISTIIQNPSGQQVSVAGIIGGHALVVASGDSAGGNIYYHLTPGQLDEQRFLQMVMADDAEVEYLLKEMLQVIEQ